MNNQVRAEVYRYFNVNPETLSGSEDVELIVKYHGDLMEIANEVGFDAEILSPDYAIINAKLNQIIDIVSYSEIEYLELPKILKYNLIESISSSCITPVHNNPSFRLFGKGTVVGIIDSGIDYTHPDFRDENGGTRILYIWDQRIVGNKPPGFSYGTEYTKDQIDEALASTNPFAIVPSFDYIGHGTAVTGVAAGNGITSGGRDKGVAPEASIIVVRLGNQSLEGFARSTEIMRAIKYIIDRAEELNMPVSINISYGTNDGSHDGDSLFETFINSMSERWKTVIVVATGNEASAGHHYAGVVQQGENLEISFIMSGFNHLAYMAIWKNFVDTFVYRLTSPDGNSTGDIQQSQRTFHTILDNVRVAVIMVQPTQYNTGQEFFIHFEAVGETIPQGVWTLNIYGQNVVAGNINIWLPTIEDVTSDTAFSQPSVNTTLTIPSTAYRVVSVGGYNAFAGVIASFSGRGYTRKNVYIKPDLVAPAVGVLTTRTGGGYDTFSGTSIAAPFVTGSAALMMEWGIIRGNDPFLYGQRVKAFLQRGARRETFISYPNPLWGYGMLCLENTMDSLVEYFGGGLFG